MSTLGNDTTSGRRDPGLTGSTGVARSVTGTRQEAVHADTAASTLITAEIPAVPVHRSYGVLLPDGSVWYPGSKRRLPAAWPLRFVVWMLALVVFLMVCGIVVLKAHPSWLAPLRHTVSSAPPTALLGSGAIPSTLAKGQAGGSGSQTATSGSFHLVSQTADGNVTTITYSVPAQTFTILYVTTARCFVRVLSVPSGTPLYETTQAGKTSHPIDVNGAASVQAAAKGSSLGIYVNNKLVPGSAISDVVYQVVYVFQGS